MDLETLREHSHYFIQGILKKFGFYRIGLQLTGNDQLRLSKVKVMIIKSVTEE